MSRITLACAVISGITAAACSLGMTDLSGKSDDGRTSEVPTNGAQPAGNDPSVLESSTLDAGTLPDDDDDAAVPDNKLDDAGDAGAPIATGCQLVTFTPASAVSSGGGQSWNGAANALVDDGSSTTASLSENNRDSAVLVFGGFTGPAIPSAAVIKGFLVDVDRSAGGTCIMAKNVVATIGGATLSRSDANDPWQGVRFYGGLEDVWGGTIAPAQLAAPFTVAVQTRMVGSSCRPREARLDTLRVRVHYCVK